MKGLTGITLLLALCCAVAFGCSKKEEIFVGKWVGRTGSFVFAADMTGTVTPAQPMPNLPAIVPFTWSVEGGDEVRITLPSAGGKTTIGRLKENNVLVVEDDNFVKQ